MMKQLLILLLVIPQPPSDIDREIRELRQDVAVLRKLILDIGLQIKKNPRRNYAKPMSSCLHSVSVIECGYKDVHVWYECEECGKRWDKKPK